MSKTKDTANRINPADYDALTFWTGVRSEQELLRNVRCLLAQTEHSLPWPGWV